MELMRVLVVEDNSVVADAVAEGLRDEGIAVDVAYDGPAGLDKVTVNTYDVIVLDRDLPRLHGDALCQQIVDSPSTSRILMLTAAALVEDRVNGLNLGGLCETLLLLASGSLPGMCRKLVTRRIR